MRKQINHVIVYTYKGNTVTGVSFEGSWSYKNYWDKVPKYVSNFMNTASIVKKYENKEYSMIIYRRK